MSYIERYCSLVLKIFGIFGLIQILPSAFDGNPGSMVLVLFIFGFSFVGPLAMLINEREKQ